MDEYIYTDKHSMFEGRVVPAGTFVETPASNRLLGMFSLNRLLAAGVVRKVSTAEARELRRALKELADNAAKARGAKPAPVEEPKAGGES